MTLRVVFLSLFIFISQQTFAKLPPKPLQCPTAASIKASGLSGAEAISGDIYAVYQFSDYGLNEKWGFVLLFIEANNEYQALQKGNKILPSLSGSPIPTPTEDNDGWMCNYNMIGDYIAAAVNLDDMNNLSNIRKFSQKHKK